MGLNLNTVNVTGNMYVGIPLPDPKNDFVIYIDTSVTSYYTTPADQFRFQAVGKYDIDWGDGTLDIGVSGFQTHTYSPSNSSHPYYEIRVRNWVDEGSGIRLDHSAIFTSVDSLKILEIRQWGTTAWTSMAYAFTLCAYMIGTFTDKPNLSACTSTEYMFGYCAAFNTDISDWDVSNITNMADMFYSASVFNQPLGSWDVSNVTTLYQMFQAAYAFNQPLNTWNVSNVTNMFGVFWAASSFNQPLSSWNVSNATNMFGMFTFTPFNQDISMWDVSSVTNMGAMFWNAYNFSQDISGWNVSNVTNMYGMFRYASSFNQDISVWNVSNVTDMHQMFMNNYGFNQDISTWDVRKVEDMSEMFNSSIFNQNLGAWQIRDLTAPFLGIGGLNGALDSCGMSTANYSQTLIGWANYVSSTAGGKLANTPASIPLGALGRTYDGTTYTVPPGSPYSDAVAARAYLAATPGGAGWTITGDSP